MSRSGNRSWQTVKAGAYRLLRFNSPRVYSYAKGGARRAGVVFVKGDFSS